MLAVVAIMAMVFAIGAPRLGSSKLRLLKEDAEAIAASLDFARQRAVMTGTPHRLFIDLQEGAYRIEWLTVEEEGLGMFAAGPDDLGPDDGNGPRLGGEGPLDLRPPPRGELEYMPVPHRQYGAFAWVHDAVYFVGLNSPGGWIESGSVVIGFEADGTTEYALLEIADADDNHLTLEIEPMIERVRRFEGSARS